MRILWSPQSLRDLDAIREYIAKDSEHYAGLTIARIFSAVEQLIQFPQSGRIVPERDEPQIREVIVGRFRVVYRVQNDLIEVATSEKILAGGWFTQRGFRCMGNCHASYSLFPTQADAGFERATPLFADYFRGADCREKGVAIAPDPSAQLIP